MHYHSNNKPKLVTLSGINDYEDDFMGADWGVFDWARPSKLATYAPVAGIISGALAVAFPPAAIVLGPLSAGLITTGVVAKSVWETYRSDQTAPPPSQLQYQVVEPSPDVKSPEPEKKTPWGLLAAGAAAAYFMFKG